MNWMKTFILMAALTALFVLIGDLVGGRSGMLTALVLAGIMNFFSYWFSDKIVLMMYGARPVDESEAPRLYSIVKRLTQSAGLPMPKVYIVPVEQPNAFATGRDPQHAAVAVTEGIMRILNEEELEGVIAHELAHVKNRDILLATIAATIAGAIMMLSRMALWFGGRRRNESAIALLIAMIIAPIAALVIQMAISRSREFGADGGGARISGKPLALARALAKLHNAAHAIPMDYANSATAHMFIVNPFSARGLINLFSTHPPIEERIARLQSMAIQ
ncbi:MAG: zinc metalloprotease HtpX [Armatimonadota bacterium]